MDKDFYNKLNMPVIAAPLFLISGPKLVIECCKKGIVGTFPALNQRTSEGFEEWVIEIKDELSKFEGCFITGTAAEITPVSCINNNKYKVCDLILDLSKSYEDLVGKN